MVTKIIVGALLTDFAIIIGVLMYIGARSPKNPWWANENAMKWILPLVTGAIVIGPLLLVEGFVYNFNSLGSTSITICLALLGSGAGILSWISIPKQVATFDVAEKGRQ